MYCKHKHTNFVPSLQRLIIVANIVKACGYYLASKSRAKKASLKAEPRLFLTGGTIYCPQLQTFFFRRNTSTATTWCCTTSFTTCTRKRVVEPTRRCPPEPATKTLFVSNNKPCVNRKKSASKEYQLYNFYYYTSLLLCVVGPLLGTLELSPSQKCQWWKDFVICEIEETANFTRTLSHSRRNQVPFRCFFLWTKYVWYCISNKSTGQLLISSFSILVIPSSLSPNTHIGNTHIWRNSSSDYFFLPNPKGEFHRRSISMGVGTEENKELSLTWRELCSFRDSVRDLLAATLRDVTMLQNVHVYLWQVKRKKKQF